MMKGGTLLIRAGMRPPQLSLAHQERQTVLAKYRIFGERDDIIASETYQQPQFQREHPKSTRD